MRQLTASEARDETRDRQEFEEIMTEGMPELQRRLTLLRIGDGYRYRDINDLWDVWQAALKSKQGEV